ncbi:MAG: SLBB domain-containing protein [Pseudomonadota bacterium]
MKKIIFLLISCISFTSCSMFMVNHFNKQIEELNWYSDGSNITNNDSEVLAIYDLDQNGLKDIIFYNTTSPSLTVDFQKNPFIFENHTITKEIDKIASIAFADLNNDSKIDIVIGTSDPDYGLYVLTQNEELTWSLEKINKREILVFKILIKDLNNDLKKDIVVANSYSELNGGFRIYLSNNNFEYNREISPTSYHLYSDLVFGDINKDNQVDIIASSIGPDGEVFVWKGEGLGSFTKSNIPSPKNDYRNLLVTQTDDGPAILASTNTNDLFIHYHDKEKWYPLESENYNYFYRNIREIDIDNQNNKELILVDKGTGRINIIWKTTAHPLKVIYTLRMASNVDTFFIDDIDNNGLNDFIVKFRSGLTSIYYGKRKNEKDFFQFITKYDIKLRNIIYGANKYAFYQDRWLECKENEVTFSEDYSKLLEEIGHLYYKDPNILLTVSGYVGVTEKLSNHTPYNLSKERVEHTINTLIDKYKINKDSIINAIHADNIGERVMGKVRLTVYIPYEATFLASNLNRAKTLDTGDYDLSEYKIGPGDILQIVHRRESSFDKYEVTVNPEGEIAMSLVGNIRLVGLSLTGAQKKLTDVFSIYYKTPQLEVTIKEYTSQPITLFGAINYYGTSAREGAKVIKTGPGVYYLTEPTKVLDLITMAGGFSKTADLENVAVTRKRGDSITLNIQQALTREDISQNIYILPGDMVYVPELFEHKIIVSVFGSVKSPGTYPYKKGWRALDLLSTAGGLAGFTDGSNSKIIRRDETGRIKEFEVNFENILDGKYKENIEILEGDILYVPE